MDCVFTVLVDIAGASAKLLVGIPELKLSTVLSQLGRKLKGKASLIISLPCDSYLVSLANSSPHNLSTLLFLYFDTLTLLESWL